MSRRFIDGPPAQLWQRVDVAHLEVLRELSARGSVTAVARAVDLSPSAVSQQLEQLQRRLDVVLGERAGRGVRLTDAGRALAGIAATVSTALAGSAPSPASHSRSTTRTWCRTTSPR